MDEEVVLLVDDDPAVRESTRRLLSRRAYRVVGAGSPEEALSALAGEAREVDLLLTDVVMPGMSGWELATQIRELRPDLPVLYMSGNPGAVIEPERPLPPGMSFLSKPFQPQALFAAVQQALKAKVACDAG